MALTPEQIQAQNEFAGIYGFRPTQVWKWMLNSPCTITALFCGNQFGKGESMVMDWVLRFWGKHPQKHKNILPGDKYRTLRVCCESLPQEKDAEETKNTIYPVFKRRLPPSWITGEITARKPVARIRCPLNIDEHRRSGKDINVEYVSYGQEVQAQAGVQRRAIMQDEESNKDFFEEQQARMLATGGDMLIGFTPVPGQIGWMYDDIYERAKYIYRTPLVRQRIKDRFKEDFPELETTNSKDDICVIMSATDDNPMYADLAAELGKRENRIITPKEYLDEFFSSRYGDEDVIDARRFGLFRQLSGKVHKSFTERVHKIDGHHYFPMGLPHEWKHARGIDYHEKNPWAGVWICVSPTDEIFVYRDGSWTPGRIITYDICQDIASASGDYTFKVNRIDPLANKVQSNTNRTTVQDINEAFRLLRGMDIGTGGYWSPWDTKGNRGREEMTKRLLNSIKVGRPFNNTVEDHGRKVQLPTIWFFDTCKITLDCMKNWRYEDWESRQAEQRNDEKEKPQQRWSHWPIAIECLLKENEISRATWNRHSSEPIRPKHYFRRVA